MKKNIPKPFAYVHEDCGTVTTMSRGIVNTMHADPFFYLDGYTICAECGEVSESKCTLKATGENLKEYCDQLKTTKSTAYHVVRWGIYVLGLIVGIIVVSIAGPQAPHPITQPWAGLFGAFAGLFLAFLGGKYIRLVLCKTGII